jgi:hypothetical protein
LLSSFRFPLFCLNGSEKEMMFASTDCHQTLGFGAVVYLESMVTIETWLFPCRRFDGK